MPCQCGKPLRIDPGVDDIQYVQAVRLNVKHRIDVGVEGAPRDDVKRADPDRRVDLQPVDVGEAEFAHHREQFLEQAVEMDRRTPVEQIEALERAVVVVEMRYEHRREW